tara:strand:- start:93 stop:1676 length:1584 start_codon:yes stop_codon:yes gene_type:complete
MTKPNFQLILQQGFDAYIKGNFIEAERHYTTVLQNYPSHPKINNDLGLIQKSLGKLDEAELSFKKAIDLKPDFAESYNNLGNTLKEFNNLEKLKEAEKVYKNSIKLKPDYAEAHNNLGVTLQILGKLDEAELSFKKAIEFKPDFANSYMNYGNLSIVCKKYDEAITLFKKAVELDPNLYLVYYNLGVVLFNQGKLDEAEKNYLKVINFNSEFSKFYNKLVNSPYKISKLINMELNITEILKLQNGLKGALEGKGKVSFCKKNFESALIDFDLSNNESSRAFALISLYNLGRIDEIYQRIEKNSELDKKNRSVAAFASFIAQKEKKETKLNFCKNPLNFIYYSNISSQVKDSNYLIARIIKELNKVKTIWEPHNKTTKNGSQSRDNLFENPSRHLNKLKLIILDELDLYRSKFQDDSSTFIQDWPLKKTLLAWHLVMKQQGYQLPHIHWRGWVSGVIYLKVVPALKKNEGAIEFGLNGEHYSDVNSPKVVYSPKIGDIVFFPSSLHHNTIPFTTDTDRISIAFDMVPT